MLIAVDFDGTIVTHEYPSIGKPIPFAIDVLKRLQTECHHQLILWTVREGELLQEAVDYCASQGLVFYAVNSNYPETGLDEGSPRKLNVDLFIDDRNIGGLPDWGVIYRMIKYGDKKDSHYADNPPTKQEKQKKPFLSFFNFIKKN